MLLQELSQVLTEAVTAFRLGPGSAQLLLHFDVLTLQRLVRIELDGPPRSPRSWVARGKP